MNLVLGFVGSAYAGKDTTSTTTTEAFFNSMQISGKKQVFRDPHTNVTGNFATLGSREKVMFWHTPLALEVKREYAQESPGVNLDKLLYDTTYKSQHREGLIRIGDGRRETVDPLYWIKKTQATIKHLLGRFTDYNHHVFSITDMRYENELPNFEAHCYSENIPILSFKIMTDLAVILQRMPQSDIANYMRRYKNNPSERNIKRVHADIEIDNNGTLEQLNAQVKTLSIPLIKTVLFGYAD